MCNDVFTSDSVTQSPIESLHQGNDLSVTKKAAFNLHLLSIHSIDLRSSNLINGVVPTDHLEPSLV